MSQFTQIGGEEVIIPPTEQKVFNKKWIKHLRINSESPTSETIVVSHLIPYNGSGEVLPDPVEMVIINDLFGKLTKFPKMAQAMELILQSLVEYRAYRNEILALREKQLSLQEGESLTEEELAKLAEAKALKIQ